MAYYDRELLRLLPGVLRARDFHLYLEGGKRLVDLWRAGGKAILGHKPPRVLSELKNAGERGLFTPLPHPAERRFIKALAEFFPGRAFRLYTDENSLNLALEKNGLAPVKPASSASPFNDPAFPAQDRGNGRISLWRPFLQGTDGYADLSQKHLSPGREGVEDAEKNSNINSEALRLCEKKFESISDTMFIPVLPWPLGPVVLVLGKNMEDSFPPGELIPPVLLASATRALYDLSAVLKTFAPDRGGPQYSKIGKALRKAQADGTGTVIWRRRGIYLTVEPQMDGEKYKTLFRRFLEGGFLIPPSPEEPAILPLSMSPGEEAKLAQLLCS